MNHFCTYFDRHYLPRALALYRSLETHCPEFRLWVLCLDDASHEILSRLHLPHMALATLEELERGDERLLAAKSQRTPVEYYFTCTPSWTLYLLNQHPEIPFITYLDADLFFFADPAPLFREIGDHSIAIIEHRYSHGFEYLEDLAGKYNVGWVSFRRDANGLRCLQWWREACLQWCHDYPSEGRFADQKYLDDWLTRFPGVISLQHKGANVAPWNLARYPIHAETNPTLIDDQPLIFYHFHGLKQIRPWLFYPGLAEYKIRAARPVRRNLYAPYIRTLAKVNRQLAGAGPGRLRSIRPDPVPRASSLRVSAHKIMKMIRRVINVATGNCILFVNGRVI